MQKVKMFFYAVLGIAALAVTLGIMGTVLSGGSKNPPLARAELRLEGQVFDVELARTALEKMRGLSGREGLTENGGMLFLFDSPTTQSFWMKGMKFPIDIVWIAGDRVVGFAENVQPEPGKSDFALKMYSSPEPADKVLEVRAGTVQKLSLEIGDEVAF